MALESKPGKELHMKGQKLVLGTGGFAVVTAENIVVVKSHLADGDGRILVAQKGPGSHGPYIVSVSVDLFDHPTFSPCNIGTAKYAVNAHLKTGSPDDWRPVLKNGRNYLLRRVPEPSPDDLVNRARTCFDRLMVGSGWEFKIGPQCVASASIHLDTQLVLFVPYSRDASPALRFCLEHFSGRINESMVELKMPDAALLPEHHDQILAYATNDLLNGEVLLANIGAGIEADALTEA